MLGLRTQSVLSTLLVAAVAHAQVQFEPTARATLPLDLPAAMQCATFDVDGDRDLDLVLAATDPGTLRPSLYVMRNDGSGEFGAPEITVLVPTGGGSTAINAMTAGDVDGDGDLDLVVGRGLIFNLGGQTLLLLNDGAGHFSRSPTLPVDDGDGCGGLLLFDCDGDRDLDLFLCGFFVVFQQSPERLLINDGAGTFTPSARPLPQDGTATISPIAGDVDRDGDLDLLVLRGTSGVPPVGGTSLFLNDGLGGFTDATATHLPPNLGVGGLRQVLFDADGDLDLDLAIASPGDSLFAAIDRLILNDGTGHFPNLPVNYFPLPVRRGITALVPFDLDGDLDLDLFVARVHDSQPAARLPAPDAVWENDGLGHYIDVTARVLPPVSTAALDPLLADLDGDGDTDVCVAGRFRLQYYRNEVGSFVDDSRHRVPEDLLGTGMSQLVDVDGDGDADLLAARTDDQQVLFAANDGDGGFHLAAASPAFSSRFVPFDADGDGDPDLLWLVDGQNRLSLNNGAGVFTDATVGRLPAANAYTIALLPVDVDGDRDLDLLQTDQVNPGLGLAFTALINDGTGVFSIQTGVLPPALASVPALATDLDGDGDIDVLAASPWIFAGIFAPALLVNGGGSYTLAPSSAFPNVNESITNFAVGDVDGDGDLDVLLGAGIPPAPNYGQNHLFLNTGNATFVDAPGGRLPTARTDAAGLALVDLDDDGDLDLCDVPADVRNRLLLAINDGTGRFIDRASSRVAGRTYVSGSLQIADVDGDGDPDLVTGGPRVLINHHSQIRTPRRARLGRTFAIEASIEPGYGFSSNAVWLWYSAGRAPQPVVVPPFGSFRLDAASLVFERRLTTGGGHLTHGLVVPALPGLLGLRLEIQGALFHGTAPSAARFSNALTEEVGR